MYGEDLTKKSPDCYAKSPFPKYNPQIPRSWEKSQGVVTLYCIEHVPPKMHVPPKRMLAELTLNEFLIYSMIDFVVDVVLVVASR